MKVKQGSDDQIFVIRVCVCGGNTTSGPLLGSIESQRLL